MEFGPWLRACNRKMFLSTDSCHHALTQVGSWPTKLAIVEMKSIGQKDSKFLLELQPSGPK